MGGRKFQLRVRKYQERKKPLSLIVSIKLIKDISVLTVSLPRELYITCPVDNLSALKARLECGLPPQWFFSFSGTSLVLFKVQHQNVAGAVEISLSLIIDEHLRWSVKVGERILSPVDNSTLASIPCILSRLSDVLNLFTFLSSCKQCIGNSEQKFMDVVQHRQSTQQGIIQYMHSYTISNSITYGQIPNCEYRYVLIIG